mgnify:CR=1 FL=1
MADTLGTENIQMSDASFDFDVSDFGFDFVVSALTASCQAVTAACR